MWDYFLELHNARSSNGFGPVPLSYTEIDAWRRLTNQRLDPWELSAIVRLDGVFMTVHAEASKPEGQSG